MPTYLRSKKPLTSGFDKLFCPKTGEIDGNFRLGAAAETDQPESNATRQLEKPRVRRKARADQAILQEKGPDALPVSDYPQKEGPVAANTIDQQERKRSGNSHG